MAPIPQHLQVPQLRLRSILAGLQDLPSDEFWVHIPATREGARDAYVTLYRAAGGREPRTVTIELSKLLALARLESDHPARAPVAATPLHVPPNARGKTFDPAKDEVRLGRVLEAVLTVMKDGQWRTLFQIRSALAARDVHTTEAGISARLRDLRKPWGGGHTVESERVPETSGLWRYRVLVSA
jgi:hypothetical protein